MTAAAAPSAGRREWVALAVIALPCLLYSMDLTVLYLALPSLTADLKPSSAQLLWITDVYGFMLAGFLITMGTLGDRIGRRRARVGAGCVRHQCRDADRGAGAARDRGGDAGALDPLADPEHLSRLGAADVRDRRLGDQLFARRCARAAARRAAAPFLLVGLGVPAGCTGDGAAARGGAGAAAGVPQPRGRPLRPGQRHPVARVGAGTRLRHQGAGPERLRPRAGAIDPRRACNRARVRSPPAEACGAADRPAPLPHTGVQRVPGREHAQPVPGVRNLLLDRAVPAASARPVPAPRRTIHLPPRATLHPRTAPGP